MGRCGGRRGTVFAILSGEKEGVSSFQLLGKDCDSRLLLFFPQISRVVKAYYEQMYIGTPQIPLIRLPYLNWKALQWGCLCLG